MFKVKIEKTGIKELNNRIEYIKKLAQMQVDSKFQMFIEEKCLNEVKTYAKSRLMGTTNASYYQEYIDSIRIRKNGSIKNGFEIISDLTIEKPTTKHSKGYTFSISMAFEYGTGIVGLGSTDAPGNYRYNVNDNYVKINGELVQGWWLPKELASDSPTFGETKNGKAVVTQGYEGLEIFRFSGANIMQKLLKWVNEYFSEVR